VVARDAAGNQASDTSDYNFTIAVLPGDPLPPTVDILSPDGDEILIAGRTYKIMWSSEDNDGVVAHDVYYSIDGGLTFTLIVANLSGITRSYTWTVPTITTSHLRIRVVARDPSGNAGGIVSNSDCSILTASEFGSVLAGIESIVEVNPSPPEEGYPEYTGGLEPQMEAIMVPDMVEDFDPAEVLQSPDQDGDGILDGLERLLARRYDSYYHWDRNEPNNFCFLQNQSSLACGGFVSHTTPLVYYRVSFLGCTFYSGRLWRQYIIDYLTIWDHDAGLCSVCLPRGVTGHQWDVERTAALVLSTATDGHSVNLNDYTLLFFYLSAHEGVDCFDNSSLWRITDQQGNPVPGLTVHFDVAWTWGKHANYLFNVVDPGGLMIWTCGPIPVCFRVGGVLICVDPFLCVYECFSDGGSARATNDKFINVGELAQPMQQWINDSKVGEKLDPPKLRLRVTACP
jgi:hypothetical protein